MVTSCGEHSKQLVIIEKLVCIEVLLIAILARLPPKSIFRFKCVSKTWNRILVEPFFLETYYKVTRNQMIVGYHGKRLLALITSNTLTLTHKKYDVSELVPIRYGDIRHSYNGLVLCQAPNSYPSAAFYIFNPLTRMCVILPPTPEHPSSPGLTWEENTHDLVPSYKVVQVYDREEKNKVVIGTYCSKSGKWEQSTLSAKEDCRTVSFLPPLVSNGVFHWYMGINEALVVYDSNRDEKHVQLIKFPGVKDMDSYSGVTMSSFDGILWYGSNAGRRDWMDPKIKFWILPKDKLCESYKYATTIEKNEWILMHSICVKSFCDLNDIKPLARCVYLLALFPCHPLLVVLGYNDNIYLYNLETKCADIVPHRSISDFGPRDRSLDMLTYIEMETSQSHGNISITREKLAGVYKFKCHPDYVY